MQGSSSRRCLRSRRKGDAIAHALLSPKLIVEGITAEHFAIPGSVQQSLKEIQTVLQAMGKDIPAFLGEEGALDAGADGNSPAVAVTLNSGCGHYIEAPAPWVNEDTSSSQKADSPVVRIYSDVDSRYVLEDFINKLQLMYA